MAPALLPHTSTLPAESRCSSLTCPTSTSPLSSTEMAPGLGSQRWSSNIRGQAVRRSGPGGAAPPTRPTSTRSSQTRRTRRQRLRSQRLTGSCLPPPRHICPPPLCPPTSPLQPGWRPPVVAISPPRPSCPPPTGHICPLSPLWPVPLTASLTAPPWQT